MNASSDLGSPSSEDELVTVVTPAFNAEGTIDETLRSARSQTYRNLEILVIDDGSTDCTADIAARHAQEDPRVRLIKQANSGVARARNLAISEARGGLIAPLDADDLWAPTKIEKQIKVMRSASDHVALVYTFFSVVDDAGFILYDQASSGFEGRVLPMLSEGNFIGNGSSALMRKAAIIEVGGYDCRLREIRAEGCEDFLLYCRIAERYEFGVVRERLTGYRERAISMSSDGIQMIKSFREVEREISSRHAELAKPLRGLRAGMSIWLLHRSVQARNWIGASYLLLQITRVKPLWLWEALYGMAKSRAKRVLTPASSTSSTRLATRRRFEIGELMDGPHRSPAQKDYRPDRYPPLPTS
jgi:glycosyltransferase involved in cell wall biosynthesis